LAPTTINPFRPQTFFNLFLLLYATGLRISEALGLQWNDVDWYAGTILISESKFHKTRVVPLHKEMLSSLLKYRRVLDSSEGCPSGNSPVFQQGGGRAYSCITARQVWRSLLRLCNIEVSTGKKVPRIHDLRHSFAVERITLWYQEGADVQNLQPRLATYMGHKNLRSTQYYITITMEILKSAGERFECVCSPRRRK